MINNDINICDSKIDNQFNNYNTNNLKRKCNIDNDEEQVINSLSKLKHMALICNVDFNENKIVESNLGKLGIACKFCGAFQFKSETKVCNKTFTSCCHIGKIILSMSKSYPDKLLHLINENSKECKHYQRHIREYNNSLAFGSFGAKFDKLKGIGPHIFRICGQVYHNSDGFHSENIDEYKFGQLYILDNELANEIRCNNSNDLNLSLKVLKNLDTLLRKINPYAKAYRIMYEVEEKEKSKCEKLGIICPTIKMFLTRNPSNIY